VISGFHSWVISFIMKCGVPVAGDRILLSRQTKGTVIYKMITILELSTQQVHSKACANRANAGKPGTYQVPAVMFLHTFSGRRYSGCEMFSHLFQQAMATAVFFCGSGASRWAQGVPRPRDGRPGEEKSPPTLGPSGRPGTTLAEYIES